MFASRKTKAIDTPTDPAYTVTIKALSGRAKQRAATAVLAHAAEMIQAVGGAEVFAQINSMSSGERAQERRAADDRAEACADGRDAAREVLVGEVQQHLGQHVVRQGHKEEGNNEAGPVREGPALMPGATGII